MAANGIVDANRKRSILPSVRGSRLYKLLRSLAAPAKPADKTFDELVSVMTRHHSPPTSEIMQRYRFLTRFRQQEESIAIYVSELRSLAQTCNFGALLDNMLRDCLVCGISNDAIQRGLLSESSLTFGAGACSRTKSGRQEFTRNSEQWTLGVATGAPQEVYKVTQSNFSRRVICLHNAHSKM